MGTDNTQRYLPWTNDALVRGESLYAVLNKLAWFAGRGPLQLIRDLRATQARPSPNYPQRIDFHSKADEWWKEIVSLPHMPAIFGLSFGEYLYRGRRDFYAGSAHRITQVLRYCPDCISLGMHFDVTQFDAVAYCPHHRKRITSRCEECWEDVPYECVDKQDAFSCSSCNSSFLNPDLTSLRSNPADRWRAAGAHAHLLSKIEAAPDLLRFGCGGHMMSRHGQGVSKYVRARMLDSLQTGTARSLTVATPYVAVQPTSPRFQ